MRRSATVPAGSDGRGASVRPPDEHHHGAEHVPSARITSHVGPAGFAARGTRRPRSTAISRARLALAGTIRPHRHDAAVDRRIVGIDARKVPRRRERRQRVMAISRTPWSAGTDADPLRVASTSKRVPRNPGVLARVVTRESYTSDTKRMQTDPSAHAGRYGRTVVADDPELVDDPTKDRLDALLSRGPVEDADNIRVEVRPKGWASALGDPRRVEGRRTVKADQERVATPGPRGVRRSS